MKKGFTLIELLVVIAIIGILAAMVLVSLGAARTKAKDARVISDVGQIRVLLEADYSGSGAYSHVTTASHNALTADIQSNGGTYIENITTTPYLVGAKLTGATYFCLDSNGKSYQGATAITAASVGCPS